MAVLSAAPAPVITPQPISDAISNGMSGAIFTTACFGKRVFSANVPAPAIAWTGTFASVKWGSIIEPN